MSVVDEISTRLQTIQTLLKCRHADRIINNVDAPAAGKPLHFGFEILSGINNDLVGARASRQLAFPFISDSRVYGCSKLLCDLDQQKTDTARARVHKRGLTGFQRKRAVREVMRGHALQHDRSAEFEVDVVRQLHELPCRNRRTTSTSNSALR